ncbi:MULTISPECIES: YtzI protein [unclassified Virgibacillus]|uniref:YtzI protein n=1 Tax=unclassified Virgibacillus TaxID=2620237 RepID=UPI0024DE3B08|nr:YtzI protein [Virgibacillus sp. LDC-1]
MIGWIIGMIAICVVILVLSLFTISKGYAYKHTIDPLPDNDQAGNASEGNNTP